MGIPFFANHIRALTESFHSKLTDAGNPLEDTYFYQGLCDVPHGQPKRKDVRQAYRGHPYKAVKSTQ